MDSMRACCLGNREPTKHYFRYNVIRVCVCVSSSDISDPGSRDIRRLVINGKSSSHIDVSLLVIYAWLGLVVIMIAITILIFKYKQQVGARHRRRIVKNIWGMPKYGGTKVVITDESVGVSQLLGDTPLDCPQSLCLWAWYPLTPKRPFLHQ